MLSCGLPEVFLYYMIASIALNIVAGADMRLYT